MKMNEENKKQKKKMTLNKKLLMFGILPLFVVLVSALGYYAMFSQTVNITQPLSFNGLEQSVDCNSGETCLGKAMTVTNDGDTPRIVKIVKTSGSEDIGLAYVGLLELTKKNTTTWKPTGIEEDTVEITYTVVGEIFEYSGVPEGYTLVYYKDAIVGLEGRLESPQSVVQVIDGNLPQEDDANLDANYSDTPDWYAHSTGAKLWAVPNEAILAGNVLDWSLMNDFYYETDLIYYFDNIDNEITVPANSFITFYPEFTPSTYLDTESYIFNFEIQ